MEDQDFDVIVYGATSFVGQIICRYMVREYGVDGDLKWAIAGRSANKLEHVKNALGESASQLPKIIADASNESALKALCAQTKVVLSTVGPYALYGEPLIRACVATGTDYCDLTGEVQWIYRMIKKYQSQAQLSGARIVNCCGFDSVPSDLGVFFLQQQAKAQFGAPCSVIKMRVKAAKGGVSGGTAASMMQVMREVKADSEVRSILRDPFALCFDDTQKPRQPQVMGAVRDTDSAGWLGPFLMEGINSRVVHRSNKLLGYAYGNDFCYSEAQMTGKGRKGWLAAQALTWGTGGVMLASAFGPTRWLLENYVMPAPGEGPSPAEQKNGFYDLRFWGETAQGDRLQVKVTGDQDPGYGSTAKMVSEAAVCLAKDAETRQEGGFWTPSSVMGEALLERLQQRAGLVFTELE